jgi:D-aminopeptidase
MSVIDTIVDAVAPRENERAHQEARTKAKAVADSGDWLSLILEHHELIEAAFAAVKSAGAAPSRTAAQKVLAVLLTGHANAEESVIYPALTRVAGKGYATEAYSEQATAKTEMAALETLAPMSPEYLQKLEHIRDAVAHHVYQEESTWFLALKTNASAPEQITLARRYKEEFDRYVGGDAGSASTAVANPESNSENTEGITTQHRVPEPPERRELPLA